MLNYVVYRVNEPPSSDNYESNYGAPLPGLDKVFLLWDKGRAVGFATTRLVRNSLTFFKNIRIKKEILDF